MTTMRLAIFGGGKGAVPHMRALRDVQDIELVAIAEANPVRRRELEQEFRVRTYEAYEALLEAERPDAVLVALPHHLHVPASLAAIEAGAHVLVEKPMATTVEGCERMIEAARRAGRTVMVGQTHHFYPNVMEARRILQSGELGDVLMATDAIYSPYFENRPAWFFDLQAAGGGSWMANGVHLVDRTCWILNDLPETVYARMTFHPELRDIETSASVVLGFRDGKTATILMAMQANGPKEEGEIHCTKGSLRFSAFGGMARSDGRTSEAVTPTVKGNARALQLREFATAVRDGRPPSVPGEWGREMVRIVLAAYESHRLGQTVSLSPMKGDARGGGRNEAS